MAPLKFDFMKKSEIREIWKIYISDSLNVKDLGHWTD